MIDIDEIAYSDPRIDKLSRKDRQKYDKFIERNKKYIEQIEDMNSFDLEEFVKSLVDNFFHTQKKPQ